MPYARPQVTNQGRSSDAGDYNPNEEQGSESGGRIDWGPSRRSIEASDTLPTLIGASKRNVRGMGSRKLATYEKFVPVLRLP